jgi:hypothetical protein
MRVFIGGMASRYALPVDRLDDVELAVETLVQEEPADGADLTLTVAVVQGVFRVSLAGLRSPLVRNTLSGDATLEGEKFGAQNILKMIMDSLVDEYRTADGVDPGSFAVEMDKRII